MDAPPPTSRPLTQPVPRWGWLFRLGLAVVFVVGMLASATAKPYRGEGEAELTVELDESGESLASHQSRARVGRHAHPGVRPLPRRASTTVRAPARLVPTAPEPPPATWPRPRRVPPPDDDDLIG